MFVNNTNAGYIELIKDETTALIEMTFELESGQIRKVRRTTQVTSESSLFLSLNIQYEADEEIGTAQADLSFNREGHQYLLHTETE